MLIAASMVLAPDIVMADPPAPDQQEKICTGFLTTSQSNGDAQLSVPSACRARDILKINAVGVDEYDAALALARVCDLSQNVVRGPNVFVCGYIGYERGSLPSQQAVDPLSRLRKPG
jgi:hypothetical protein